MEMCKDSKLSDCEKLLRTLILADMKECLHNYENRQRIRLGIVFFMLMLNVFLTGVLTAAFLVAIQAML